MSDENEQVTIEPKANGGKTKFIIIGVIVLLIAGAVGLFFSPIGVKLMGNKTTSQTKEAAPDATININQIAFTTLPEILLNLRNASGKSSFMKVTFTIQCPTKEVADRVDKLKPIIMDQFQEYLRGLDIEDISGSAGIQRMKNELLLRTNTIIAPDKATEILIGPFLIQ